MAAVPTPNYLVGKVVSVTAGGATMAATKGNCTRKVGVEKVTNAKSGGYQQVVPSIKSASGDCECVYDGDSPPTLEEGTEVSVVVAATSGETKTIQALITEIKDSWAADAGYSWSFNWESSGEYTVA